MQARIVTVETKPTTSEETEKKPDGVWVPHEERQQGHGTHQDAPGDLCRWDVPSHWGGVISVQTPHGPGTVCCMDCGRGKAILLLTISLNNPDDQTWLKRHPTVSPSGTVLGGGRALLHLV